jgi:hypothetical protein
VNTQELQITGVALAPEGIEIGYVRVPRDVRKNGLVWSHAVMVPRGSDYDDEIEALEEALMGLLVDALDDEDTAEAVDLTEDEDEDEEDDQ